MAKAVLISIRPEWVEKILAGEKTLEVRKTRPKLETPFKCYIYCTLGGLKHPFGKVFGGRVVGEFSCDCVTWLSHIWVAGIAGLRMVAMANRHTIDASFDFAGSCLTAPEIYRYLDGEDGYAWHISNLKIYDTPKQLSEFTRLRGTKFGCAPVEIKRPPQSWCYVEELI